MRLRIPAGLLTAEIDDDWAVETVGPETVLAESPAVDGTGLTMGLVLRADGPSPAWSDFVAATAAELDDFVLVACESSADRLLFGSAFRLNEFKLYQETVVVRVEDHIEYGTLTAELGILPAVTGRFVQLVDSLKVGG